MKLPPYTIYVLYAAFLFWPSIYCPWLEKTCLRGFANNKGADQPVHTHSLISPFIICVLESVVSRLAWSKNFNFLASLCSWADWFESHFVRNPKGRFCHDEAHIYIWVSQIPFNNLHACYNFLLSVDNLYKQFGPRSGPTFRCPWKIFFLKSWFWKTNMQCKIMNNFASYKEWNVHAQLPSVAIYLVICLNHYLLSYLAYVWKVKALVRLHVRPRFQYKFQMIQ